MKKVFWLFGALSLFLVFSILPGTVWAADVGETFDDGTLNYKVTNVSGNTGTVEVSSLVKALDDNGALNIPSTVENSGVTYTVTAIGDNAFYNDNGKTIKTVTFPDTLTRIGYRAFFYDPNLAGKLTLPDNITFIGHEAFACLDGNHITEVKLPAKLQTIEYQAFNGCKNLTSITIPNNVSTLGKKIFYNCENLQTVQLPDSLTSIPEGMFWNCKALQTINWPKNLQSIGMWAFIDCVNLKSIDLTNNNELKTILGSAFLRCTGLTDVKLPDGLTKFEASAFSGCGTSENNLNLTVRNINDYVAMWQQKEVGGNAYNNIKVKFIDADGNEVVAKVFSDDKYRYIVTGDNSVQLVSFSGDEPTGELQIPDTVTDGANITYNVTSIGASVFEKCEKITKVILPDNLESIGSRAFDHCTGLAEIIWSSTLEKIGDNAFYETAITELDLSQTQVEEISNNAFDSCKSLQTIVFPETLTSIVQDAFERCESLETVALPASLQSMGTGVFNACGKLKNLTFADDCALTVIPGRAFAGCAGLVSVELPPNITLLDGSAFIGCDNLQSIILPDGLQEIGIQALACESLSGVLELPASMTKIQSKAFWCGNDKTPLNVTLKITGNNLLNGIASGALNDVTKVICDTPEMYNYLKNVVTSDNTEVVRAYDFNKVEIKIEPETYTYTGAEIEPEIIVSITEAGSEPVIFTQGVDYKVEYINNVGIGTATVKVTREDNGQWFGDVSTKEAEFAIIVPDYELVFAADGGTGTMANIPVEMGGTYNLPECGFTAPAGQEFKAWLIDGAEYPAGAPYTVEYRGEATEITVTAVWRDIPANKYTVTYAANGGGGTMAAQELAEGDMLPLPACGFTAPAGQEFKAWLIDGAEYPVGYQYAVKGNITVTAVWQDKPAEPPVDEYFNITFELDGGALPAGTANPARVKAGEAYPLPKATKAGYKLLHWRLDGRAIDSPYKFTADTTIYAVWQENEQPSQPSGSGGGGRRPSKPAVTTPTTPEPSKPEPSQPEPNKPAPIVPSAPQPIPGQKPASEVFADLEPGAWYIEPIEFMHSRGLMRGNGDGSFAPNESTSRAMIAQILYNYAGQPDAVDTCTFADVADHVWFTKAINWAHTVGVVKGYSDEVYAPNQPITREELAVILWRFAGSPEVALELPFADSGQIAAWSAPAISWAAAEGIVIGDENNAFAPQSLASRAEAAVMIMRFCEKTAA